MSKYIDTEKLIAEIERRIEEYNIQSLRGAELADIRSFIASLLHEQPDVDLEKEAVKFVQSKEFIESKESPVLLTARHFYELGLNARKEE